MFSRLMALMVLLTMLLGAGCLVVPARHGGYYHARGPAVVVPAPPMVWWGWGHHRRYHRHYGW